MSHRIDRPATNRHGDSRSFLSPEGQAESEADASSPGAAVSTLWNRPNTWLTEDIMREVDRLVATMNHDSEFIRQAAEFKGTTLVLSATDTGRELMITIDKQGVRACSHTGESFDVKIEATEQIHWAVLSGQMDADAAFFAGKVRICGSIVTAFRVKNRLLSLLQSHLTRKLRPNAHTKIVGS